MQARFILLSLITISIGFTDSTRNPVYGEWLEGYRGTQYEKADKLRHTYVSYKNNWRANASKEEPSTADLGGRAKGILGNYYGGIGYDMTSGLDKLVAAPVVGGGLSNQGPRFDPSGFHLDFHKRFLNVGGYDFSLKLKYRKSSGILEGTKSSTTGFLTPAGETVHSLSGDINLDFFTLDFAFKRKWSQRNRYTAEVETGLRMSDLSLSSTVTGINNTPTLANKFLLDVLRDYHFRNTGFGPFVQFTGETPITRSVFLAFGVNQSYLASRGKARLSRKNRDAVGATILDVGTIQRKSTGFPVTEASLELRFFFDHATRLNVGYSYSHWNFYEIQGYGNEPFQDLSFHGPKFSLNYHW